MARLGANSSWNCEFRNKSMNVGILLQQILRNIFHIGTSQKLMLIVQNFGFLTFPIRILYIIKKRMS